MSLGIEYPATGAPVVVLPEMNLGALLTGTGPGLTPSIDVLRNMPSGAPGDDCTLGDAAITLIFTIGTTYPP